MRTPVKFLRYLTGEIGFTELIKDNMKVVMTRIRETLVEFVAT